MTQGLRTPASASETEPLPSGAGASYMAGRRRTLVVLLIQLTQSSLFLEREGTREDLGKEEGRKEGEIKGREEGGGGKEEGSENKTRKSKEEKCKLLSLWPLGNSLLGGGSLVSPAAPLLLADPGYTFSLRLVVCKAGKQTRTPHKSVGVTATFCTLAVPGSDKLIASGNRPKTLSPILVLIPRKKPQRSVPPPPVYCLCVS